METVKTAPPDGSALEFTPYACTAVYPRVYTKLGYDMARDFTPVAMASMMVHGLAVGPQVPASVTDVKGFLAWAKANPDKANYGSPGAGSTPHFLGALLGMGANVELSHVPYRGSVPGVTDMVGGSLAAMVTPLGDFLPNHRAGRLRILGHSGHQRLPFANDLPTFAEQGFGDLSTEEWFGFFAPARTPEAVVARANAAINQARKEKAVIDGLTTLALVARGSTVDEMARAQRAELERWGPQVKRVGFTAES
jgi:tripartite-type tricarboxylate transporter receptor subunit TctC